MVGILNTKAVALLNSLVDDVDANASAAAGILEIRSGAVPAAADAAATGTLLATLTFTAGATNAFNAATDAAPGATVSAKTITSDTSAVAGTATYARALDRAVTPNTVMQFTVGSGSGEIDFNSNVFTAGATVSVSSLIVTLPEI